jgi:phenylacetate-coenzyme A ligase PaaK-like adenylate-forming protein
LKPNTNSIFNVGTSEEFKQMALSVFKFQFANNQVYRNYVTALKVNTDKIVDLEQIPFMPIEFFKTQILISDVQNKDRESKVFTSSGSIQSKHYVSDVSIYEKSYRKGFELFYGNIEDYCVLALLPSYLDREGSSLIYMADDLINKSKHSASGFYLNNYDELILKLKELELQKQKTILLGVTYALLDLIEIQKFQLKHTIIMETGGMKGKRTEMVREELHAVLCQGFGVQEIHSEYGMTELLSQAYSKGNGVFNCPPWMKVLIRDTNDPFSFLPHNKTGGINVIDLANINSCSFIATQDLGKSFSELSFEVLGRFDNSDIRGCNLLVG